MNNQSSSGFESALQVSFGIILGDPDYGNSAPSTAQDVNNDVGGTVLFGIVRHAAKTKVPITKVSIE